MKAKLLGYKKTSVDNGVNSSGHEEKSETFMFFIEDEEYDEYYFTATEEHASCGSRYTSDSHGNINPELKETYIGSMVLTKPSKEIFVTIVNKQVQLSIQDPDEDGYEAATVTCVKSTDGDMIVSATGDGGCSYYSSGIVTLNSDLFEKQ